MAYGSGQIESVTAGRGQGVRRTREVWALKAHPSDFTSSSRAAPSKVVPLTGHQVLKCISASGVAKDISHSDHHSPLCLVTGRDALPPCTGFPG